MRTLIIVNTNAGGGKAGAVFKQIQDQLVDKLGEFIVAFTEKPEEVAEHLDAAAMADIQRLIAIGGDGTNHAVVNALAQRPDLGMIFGSLPVGTGRDWARTLGIPEDPEKALEWLARAKPVPCDIGQLDYKDTTKNGKPATRIFLNIGSAGIGGEVDARVNRARRRTSISFLKATLSTLLKYKPQRIRVECNGTPFYEGRSYLLVVANGRYFGRGMWVAPHAMVNDGLFDVVLVEGMPRLRILLALKTVFSGKHLERNDVHHTRASRIYVHSEEGPLGLDLDGEEAQGQDLNFTLKPGAIKVLMDPSSQTLT